LITDSTNCKTTHNDRNYFFREKWHKNSKFLNRFPSIDINNLKILDFGCGHGALSIALAERGAKEVIGVDLNNDYIKFANTNLKDNYRTLINKVHFVLADVAELESNSFDLIISKSTFEHVIDLDVVLKKLANKLKTNGKLITGFGPLYNGPFGDHNRLRHRLPWGHLLLGSEHYIKKLNSKKDFKVNNIHELGLNGYSLSECKSIFENNNELELVDFRTNVSEKFIMKIFISQRRNE